MSRLGDNSDNQFGQDAALTKLRLNSEALNNVVSLDNVYGSIQNALDGIKRYRDDLERYTNPKVEGKWFRLGGVGADQINDALSSVIKHVREGFNLISSTERHQSENLKNICLLIALLAVAEGEMYAQFAELTSGSEETADILKDLEEDLNEIASNEITAEENIKKIAQVMANILEEKNKQVLTFKNTLNRTRQETENAISSLREDLVAFKSYSSGSVENLEKNVSMLTSQINEMAQKQDAIHQDLRQQVNGFVAENDAFMKTSFSDLQGKQKESLENMRRAMNQEFETQRQFILNRTKKNFFDTTIYKILCGLFSVAAVAIALLA